MQKLAKHNAELAKFTLVQFSELLMITEQNKIVIKNTGELISNLYGQYVPKLVENDFIVSYSVGLRPQSNQYLDIYIHIDFEKLHHAIKNGLPIGNRSIVSNLLAQIGTPKASQLGANLAEAKAKIQQRLEEPVKYKIVTNRNLKNVKLQLFSYQYQNVKWMSKVERSAHVAFKYCSPDLFRYVLDPENDNDSRTIYYDKMRNRFFTENEKDFLTKYFDSFRICGGALIDEMGRGKTACAIIHCLRNSGPKLSIPLTLRDCVLSHGFERYLKTSATLVFVPNQCCAQWKDEVSLVTDSPVNIVMMTGKRDFETTTYADIITADFVICPYSFLKNGNCTKYYNPMEYTGSISDKLSTYRFELLRNPAVLEKKRPLLTMFYWKRIILDEAHEVFKAEISSTKHYQLISYLQSEFRWMLTGTPYAHGSGGLQRMLKWIMIDGGDRIGFFNSWVFDEFLSTNMNRLFPRIIRRNTNASTAHETKLPPILEQEVWIDFTEMEKAMYDDQVAATRTPMKNKFIRQFCCYPQLSSVLSNCKSIDEIHTQLITHTQREIARNNELKISSQARLHTAETLLKNALTQNAPGYRIREYSRQIDAGKKQIQALTNTIDVLTRSVNFLSNVIPQIKKGDVGECTICLDPIVDIGVTKCGHVFCYKCILDTISVHGSNKKCPTCRKNLTQADIYQVKKQRQQTETSQNSDPEFKALVSSVGSKLANIIVFLKKSFQSKHDHIIIFSQWNKLLLKVGEVLKQYDIDYVYCKGNRLSREKAIRLFNADNKVRVILLSSEYASAGTNLTRANKIYFLEPVYGTKKYKEGKI